MDGIRVGLRLPRGSHAAASGRHALEPLKDELDGRLFEDVRLLISEVVTNSVRHADSPPDDVVELEIFVAHDCVRVEVADGGSGFEAIPHLPTRDQASGWGLHLVARMSDRWGVRRNSRTRVWFEFCRGRRLRPI